MSDDGREQQRALYGEPLADIAGRLMAGLGLTQARLADTVGLSAPMLSQLLSGHRVKIGNPAVVHRLQSLVQLADEASRLAPEEVTARLEAVRAEQPTLTGARPVDAAAVVVQLAGLADADEFDRLAGLTRSPDLSRLFKAAARHG